MSPVQAGYAQSTPFDEGYLPVGDIHQLFYQQYGKKDGKPGERYLYPSVDIYLTKQ